MGLRAFVAVGGVFAVSSVASAALFNSPSLSQQAASAGRGVARTVDVRLTQPDRTELVTIRCRASRDAGRKCTELSRITRHTNERCLQIWGGPGYAEIFVAGSARGTVVTQANSCEIHRWDRLNSLIR